MEPVKQGTGLNLSSVLRRLAFKCYTGQGYINQSNQFAVEGQRACVREKHVHCENLINLIIKKISNYNSVLEVEITCC